MFGTFEPYGPVGFRGFFGGFSIIFVIVFLVIIGTFIYGIVTSAKRWHKNNNSPRLTVNATVVAKRTNTSRHTHHDMDNHSHTSYSDNYFATFQFESGDRLELELYGEQYGMLVEGDVGNLTFQGTRFLSFDRAR